MPDDSSKKTDSSVEVSVKDLQALRPELLHELHDKYGLDVQIRSNTTAINEILKSMGRGPGIGPVAEFTRGFDRTSPGYDKYYNRDFKQANPADLVINPAERERLKSIPLAEAIRSMTPEEFARLKKLHG